MSALPPGLYAVTDPGLLPEAELASRVAAAIAGGAVIVQYRDKPADADTRRRRAGLLAEACRGRALFIVNDDPALALAVAADGVHLGRDDADPAAARARLGPGRMLGVSCYDSLARAEAAVRAGADYVAFGSVFPSSTKPAAVHAPLALISAASARLPVSVVAIGGINRDNAAGVIAAGARAVAVITDLFGAADVESAARALSAACAAGRARLE